MKTKKNYLFITTKVIAILLLCIISLCAQECDLSIIDELSGAAKSTGQALSGMDNQKAKETGAGLSLAGIVIETIRSNSKDYDPGVSKKWEEAGLAMQNNVIENRNKQNERQARIEEIKTENEQQRREIIARFEQSIPRGTSSVTSPASEQNIGNPQINNLATKNGVVMTGRTGSRSQGTGAQRVGGNITTQNRAVTSRQNSAVTAQPVSEEKIVRVASVPQQTPQIQTPTIAEFTPTQIQTQPSIITSSPRQNNQAQTITPNINTEIRKGGYEYKNEDVRISCETLSPIGKQILLAIDEVAKELNVIIVITDGDRPFEQQLFYLLDRQESYPGSTSDFKSLFGKLPPRTISELTDKQKEWYQQRIEERAGKTPGFPHYGGNAVDIRVSTFSVEGKRKLTDLFIARGIKILYEIPPAYDVPVNNATVFHLYK
ncbi:MAG: hypothetical protein LBC76_09070 [Treponema sp.]|jgi:hypothetical protein|nr:hypothetical protein [Treponema sp.]